MMATTQTIADLDLSPEVARALFGAVARPRGLVLFCGPTGAGKTATVSALINMVRRGKPVVALDPDAVVDAGDVRNEETANGVVKLAESKLVLAILRSGRSRSAIGRLVDMGIAESVLQGLKPVIVSQQLCRRLCKYCRLPTEATAELLRGLKGSKVSDELASHSVYEATGCSRCTGGYEGAVPIFEVLTTTAGPQFQLEFHNESTLLDDGLLKVASGQTTLGELNRVL
jgi:type IV pilus assembly protein PilB